MNYTTNPYPAYTIHEWLEIQKTWLYNQELAMQKARLFGERLAEVEN